MNYPAASSEVSDVIPDMISLPRIPASARTGPIRGYPIIKGLVPRLRGDDAWIPAEVYPVLRYGAGMTARGKPREIKPIERLKKLSFVMTIAILRRHYERKA
jgi:hypothetical protein